MLGPHQSPIDLAWIDLTNSIILELWKFIILAYVKPRGAEDHLKTRAELKLFERKLDFWNLIEKLESRRSLENWSFKVYLKIGILKLNTRMRILEIKFERNWNFGELNLGIGILKNYLKTKF